MSHELAPCPFCGAAAMLHPVARDWWRIIVHHEEDCIMGDDHAPTAPQTPEQLELLVAAWNRRAALASSDAQADGGKDSIDNGPTVEQSTRYAKQLAVYLWRKHFESSAPSWRPLDDLYGLLSQIDNMTVDLVCADSGNGEVHAALMRAADMVQALPKHFMIGDCAEKIRQMADTCGAPPAECAPRQAITELERIAYELRAYNPAADEYKGEHICKVWAREIDSVIEQAKERQ